MTKEHYDRIKEAMKWFYEDNVEQKGIIGKYFPNDFWHVIPEPNWENIYVAVPNDKFVDLRKMQIDCFEADFQVLDGKYRWIDIREPEFHKEKQYRIKPIFKIGDTVSHKEEGGKYKITAVEKDVYYVNNTGAYIPFYEQFKYEVIKYDYPIFKVAYKGTDEEYVIKFTDLLKGEVVFALPGSSHPLGIEADNWVEHTDDRWEDVLYDKEKRLYDKQPILCWDNNCKCKRIIGFYDAINKCAFRNNGDRNGMIWDNYAPYSHPDDSLILEMYKNLKE